MVKVSYTFPASKLKEFSTSVVHNSSHRKFMFPPPAVIACYCELRIIIGWPALEYGGVFRLHVVSQNVHKNGMRF